MMTLKARILRNCVEEKPTFSEEFDFLGVEQRMVGIDRHSCSQTLQYQQRFVLQV